MEDSEIIELYWRRDEAAVGETQRKYGRYLARIARNILSSREDGEEIVNDTCMRAWSSIPPSRPDSLTAYLGKIARRLSIDALRTRTREKRGAEEYALSLSELEECVPGGAGPEELLDEATALRNAPKRRARWPKWIGAAACLALAVGVGVGLYAGKSSPRPDAASLPQLPLSEEVLHPNGMGYEGYMAYDVSELISGSPWRLTDNFQTLPVYRNPVIYDRAGAPVANVDLDAMKARALEVAERLGVEVEIQDTAPSEEEIAAVREKLGEIPEGYFAPTEVIARGDGVKITVGASLTAGIAFEPALEPASELPEGYNFGYFAPYEGMKVVSDYLAGEYRALLPMDDPQFHVTGGDYNIYGQQMYQIIAFDGAGDKTQRLLNYSFNGASFSCDDEGRLWIISLDGADLSQKVGDYPVITPEAAEKLLTEGRYITNVPHELPGAEYVKDVELLYLSGRREQYFMPYYRFLVELPEEARENGLNTYGAYYVPAVEEAYLTGLPVWDGSFN